MIRIFKGRRLCSGRVVTALSVAGLMLAPAAYAQGFTVRDGETAGPQTLNNDGDIGIVQSGGTVTGGFVLIQMLAPDLTVINRGLVTTEGPTAVGIRASNTDALVVNSGAISTTGNVSVGIWSISNAAQLDNSGTITARGLTAFGILSTGSNARISNSGSILVSGPNAHGIGSEGVNGQVINSGRIVSEQGNAMQFAGSRNNVLTLLQGSVIEGGLVFGGGTDTLIVGHGLSLAYTFDKAPEILDSNGAPFAVAGNRVALVDPTTLAAEDEALADLTGGISSAVRNRLSGVRSNGGEAGERNHWVQGFGGFRQQTGSGAALDSDLRLAGVVSGIDAAISGGSRAGFLAGGSYGEIRHSFDTQKTGIDSFYGGIYTSTLVGPMAFDFVVTGGYSDYDGEREVGNNLADGGVETATAEYGGWFVSPEVTITHSVLPFGVRLDQVLTLRYAGLFLDGFEETGGADAFTVADRDIHLGVARAALALPFESRSDDGGHGRLTLTGGIEGRTQFGGGDIAGTLLGQDIVFDAGGDSSAIAGFAGVTGEHTTADGLTVFVTLEGKVENEGNHLVSGYGGLRWAF